MTREYKLPKVLKDLLVLNNMTQASFAEEMGVAPNTITNWVNGRTYPPLYDAIRIANYFGVSADYLLFDKIQ